MTKLKGSCTVCRHPFGEKIDELLEAGIDLYALQRRYGVSRYSLMRHKKNHLPKDKVDTEKLADEQREVGPLAWIAHRIAEAKRILKAAKAKGNLAVWRQANADIAEFEKEQEALLKKYGPKEDKVRVVVSFNPHGTQVRMEPIPALPEAPKSVDEPPSEPERVAEPNALASPPRSAVRQKHVHTARCNRFTCVEKNEAADDPDPNRWN